VGSKTGSHNRLAIFWTGGARRGRIATFRVYPEMSYRIEQDDSTKRQGFAPYTYRIYDDERLIARYWHDFRGDEHEINFIDGKNERWPVGRMIDFVEGGGPEPLRLSERAVAYLDRKIRNQRAG